MSGDAATDDRYYIEVRDGAMLVQPWDRPLGLAHHQERVGGYVERAIAWSWTGIGYADAIAYVNENGVALDLRPNCLLHTGGTPVEVLGPIVITGMSGNRERGLTGEETQRFNLSRRIGSLPVLHVDVEEKAPPVTASLREQRIRDGMLVDLMAPPFALEVERLGYQLPVALTRLCYERYVRVGPGAHRGGGEEHLIVFDMLMMLRAARNKKPDRSGYRKFSLRAPMPDGRIRKVALLASFRHDTDDSTWILIGCEDEGPRGKAGPPQRRQGGHE